ncbi:TonB-dependent receptor [Succinatimonas hippei]|uniref:TonB-dependent receptor plug domain-containing protein n=1 Tax=Succinatimonas hippei TaxID=626938 RepID=UPI0025A3A15C|nr:TonB-dependent receptor [Succinatimonas hippei]MDM8119995.1 TonB-dependent receptor [Succinatimonas hippei]
MIGLKIMIKRFVVIALIVEVLPVAADEIITADTIVISANRDKQNIIDANESISVVSQDEVLLQGADTVADALQDAPSVLLVNDGTPGLKRVSIRGESAYRTLVMVDGQRITDQKTKSGAPLLINPFFIDQIEVVKGPAAVLYGSDAMGGAVNVITKKPSEDKLSTQVGLLYNGSDNAFSEYLNLSGTIENFSYALGLVNTDAQDLYISDREKVDNTSYRNKGVNAYLAWQATDDLKFEYKSEYFDVDAHTASSTGIPGYTEFRAHIPKWRRVKHSLSFELTELNDYVSSLKASVFMQQNDKDFNSSVTRQGPFVSVLNEEDSYGANLQAQFTLGKYFSLITGYDGESAQLKSDSTVTGINIQTDYGNYDRVDLHDRDFSQTTHGLYALLSTKFNDRLTLNTAVRYNRVDTEAGSSFINGIKLHGFADEVNEKAVLSAGLVYKPLANTSWRLNWSQGYRVPNLQEMYLYTFTGELQIGNPDLKPETSDNYEIGFKYEGDFVTSDFAVFYSEADNYIETVANDALLPFIPLRKFTYNNIASAKTYGADWSLQLNFDSFEPYLDISFIKRKYDTGSIETYNTGIPAVKGRTGIKYYPECNYGYLTLDFYARFASRVKQDNAGGISYFADDEYGGWTTLNLGAEYLFGDNEEYRIYGALENILDKNYQTSSLIHEPGRFVMAGVSASF